MPTALSSTGGGSRGRLRSGCRRSRDRCPGIPFGHDQFGVGGRVADVGGGDLQAELAGGEEGVELVEDVVGDEAGVG